VDDSKVSDHPAIIPAAAMPAQEQRINALTTGERDLLHLVCLSFLNGYTENRQFCTFCKVSRDDVFLHLLLFVHPSAKASAEGVPNALPSHPGNPPALRPK